MSLGASRWPPQIVIRYQAQALEQLCSQFQIGAHGLKKYYGPVLLDSDNMCMLPLMNVAVIPLGVVGGLVGGAIAGAIAHFAGGKMTQPFETTFGSLPDNVRNQPQWGRVVDTAKVIVLPRGAVKSASCSIWTGCSMNTGQTKFILGLNLFRFGKAKKLLETYGWLTGA
jgi:hypothetical protein